MRTPVSTGRLIVAAPGMADPNFDHTVVLLLEHNDTGSVGLVLNRPGEASVAGTLPAWGSQAAQPAVIFIGGPVQAGEAVVALGRIAGTTASEAATLILPGVAVLDLTAEHVAPPGSQTARFFTGYAGWGAGQLERELDAGGWFVVEARPEDVFTNDPGSLWRGVLARQGGVFVTVPEDPTSN